MTTSKQRVERAEALLAYAVTKPAGFTTYEAVEYLGCSEAQFKRSVHDLKRIQASDTMNVAWFPHEFRYKLVGSFGAAEQPRRFAVRYVNTHLESDIAQASTWLNATPKDDPDYIAALLYKTSLMNLHSTMSVLVQQSGV